MAQSNYHLTARPRILFQVRERDRAGNGTRTLFLQIYGHKPPTRIRVREFTHAFMEPGTPEYREREAATHKEDRRTLAALPYSLAPTHCPWVRPTRRTCTTPRAS
jgi:hypothetical protein